MRAPCTGGRGEVCVQDQSTRSAFQALSGLLWQERAELEGVLAALREGPDEISGVARVGQARHLLSLLELQRCVTTQELARALQLAGEPSLTRLIAYSPPGWASVLRGHHTALAALAGDVAAAEEKLLAGGPHESQRSLAEFLA